jgi:small subunit ribosomal protein S36
VTTTLRPPTRRSHRAGSGRRRRAATTGAAAAGDAAFRPLRLIRATPVGVWVITGLFALVLAGWSVLVPQYHAPDEPNHVDAVMRLEQGKGWPHPGSATVLPDGVGAIAVSPFGTRAAPYDLNHGAVPQAGAVTRSKRPAWDALADTPEPPGGVQQIVQHPPLYYALDAAILRIIPGGGDHLRWDVTIGILRLLSALMITPLPWLGWATARRLTGDPIAAGAASAVPLAVPQLTHIGSSVSNDTLLTLLGGIATLAIAYVLRGDLSLRTAGWVGTSIGLALLTKSLATVLVPMGAAAYVVAWRRARRDAAAVRAEREFAAGTDPVTLTGPLPPSVPSPAAVPARTARFPFAQLALAAVLAVAAGGWWWVVNVVRYHTFQPQTPGFPPGKYLPHDWHAFARYLFQGMTWRWWGSIGWYEVNIPWRLVVAATVVLIGLFALGIIRARGGRARTDLLFMLWPTIGLFALVAYQATSNYHHSYYITGISGRYLFAGFTGIAVGVGAGAAALPARLARWSPPILFVAAVAMQAKAVTMVGRHFWEPVGGGITEAWGAMSAWAPWPALSLKIDAGLIGVGTAASLAIFIRATRTQ